MGLRSAACFAERASDLLTERLRSGAKRPIATAIPRFVSEGDRDRSNAADADRAGGAADRTTGRPNAISRLKRRWQAEYQDGWRRERPDERVYLWAQCD